MCGHHTWQTWPFGYMATWSHVTNKKRDISTSTRAMTCKVDKVEVYSKGPPSIESFDALIMWPSYHVADGKRYISTSAGPMAAKLDIVVGSNAGLLSIKSKKFVDHMAIEGHITNEKCYKFTCSWPVSNLPEVWLMVKQLNQSTIVTGNSMYLFFFPKKKKLSPCMTF